MTQRQFIDADEANLPLQNNMQSERQTIFNFLTTFYSPIPCQRTAGIVPLLAAKQQVRKEARTTAWKSRHIFEWKKCQLEACDSLVTRVENSSPGFSLWYTTGTPLWNTSSDRRNMDTDCLSEAKYKTTTTKTNKQKMFLVFACFIFGPSPSSTCYKNPKTK